MLEESHWVQHGMLFKRRYGNKRTVESLESPPKMDITRAAAALLDADVEEETIKRLLCKYWNLWPSEAHRFIREGEEERRI